jgi:hypothetical protein
MDVLGAGDLVLTTHRSIENNFTAEEFNESMLGTIREICRYSKKYNINVNLRMNSGRNVDSLEEIAALVRTANEPNLYLSPSSALLLNGHEYAHRGTSLLKDLKCRIFMIGAPEKDIYGTLWNINKPIYNFPDRQALTEILTPGMGCAYVLDGIYCNTDEEYKDIKSLEDILQKK